MDKQTRSVMFSSEDLDKVTPWDLFIQLDAEFRFDIDLAATLQNTRCPKFFTKEDNSLIQPWTGRCWINPPYGRKIGDWIEKAASEYKRHVRPDGDEYYPPNPIVMLLPARTDTKWFAKAVQTATEIRFIIGRVKFEGESAGAPFPSCLVIWKRPDIIEPAPDPAKGYFGPYKWHVWRDLKSG